MNTPILKDRRSSGPLSFEDLKGLRAEGYVRDSTLDQRDGFGPDIQHRNIKRFAESYGLILGDRWYTEFVSGRVVGKRAAVLQFLDDARLDLYDVLLVDHTSRFGRNQEECIRYKAELRDLGKAVVFVSQGIISGRDRDFLNERINETLDEAYSRNLSRYVSAGMAEKAAQGYANGMAPLGYRSVLLNVGRHERKVPDPEAMPVLLELLRCYASGRYTYQTLADHLNAKGHRARNGRPFVKRTIDAIMSNRFYEGKVVYRVGQPDESVVEGKHEVPQEVKELWLKCQEVKARQRSKMVGRPRHEQRSYPFARVARCFGCGASYGANTTRSRKGVEVRRLEHHRQHCSLKPYSVRVEHLMAQFHEGVLPYVALDEGWRQAVVRALTRDTEQVDDRSAERARMERALANLRKQHLWGDLTDDEYRGERQVLARQLKAVTPPPAPVRLPNLERAAALLNDLPAMWAHPATSDRQRESFVQELLERATVSGASLVGMQPRPAYRPLFAYIMTSRVGNCPLEST